MILTAIPRINNMNITQKIDTVIGREDRNGSTPPNDHNTYDIAVPTTDITNAIKEPDTPESFENMSLIINTMLLINIANKNNPQA
jgi:hypothetical protein